MKIICSQCETDYPEKQHQFRSAPDIWLLKNTPNAGKYGPE